MVKGVKVNLSIRDSKTGAYVVIPVVPPSIAYSDGDSMEDTVQIINLGEVDFPNGVALDGMAWESFFPARYDPGYCATKDIKTPIQYRNIFSGWKDTARELQVICAAAGINKRMRVKSFTWELKGFEGDIYYSLALREVKAIAPRKIAVTSSASGIIIKAQAKPTPAQRPAIPASATAAAYKVKAGDYLGKIAKKLNLAGWRDLYALNKATIGSDPSKIYPGQVLKVPTA